MKKIIYTSLLILGFVLSKTTDANAKVVSEHGNKHLFNLVVKDALFQDTFIVKGTVKDEKGNPLPSVNIVIKGTKKGTQTDFDGNYKIKVAKGQILVFSFVGFKNKEVKVGDKATINVTLSEEATSLANVVVTGFRKIKANEFAGASVKLKTQDIKVGGVATVDKLLQGQAAGVSVQSTSSVFGTSPKIRIRGSSSITGINEPLWVLDGVVLQTPVNVEPSELYSGSARTLLSSALGGINPNDIEDITILKDATATALYGTKAVNGVIVITTKRARKNQKLRIDYTSSTTVNIKPSITNFDVLNSAEEIEVREKLFKIYDASLQDFTANSGGAYSKLQDLRNRKLISDLEFRKGLQGMQNINTDWFGVLFRNSIQQQHSVSASYGGEKGVSRTSLSYLKDDGYQMGQDVERYTFSNTNKFFLSDKFSVEALIKYSNRRQRNPGDRINPYSYATTSSRAMNPSEYYMRDYTDFNMINEIGNDYIKINSNEFSIQLQLDYKPIKDLNLSFLANKQISVSSLEQAATEHSSYANSFRTTRFSVVNDNDRLYRDPDKPANSLPETILLYGGILEQTNARSEAFNIRAQAGWDAIKNDIHKLNIFAGIEAINNSSFENYSKDYGYIFDSGTSYPSELALKKSIRSDKEDYYKISRFTRNQFSYYGSLNYTLLKRYILTASLRNDATNISGTHSRNRFLPTWTIAGAWSLHKENFMEEIKKVISKAKLRASYGLRGNAGNRGPDLRAYYQTKRRTYVKYNDLVIHIEEPENQDLEFEKEHIFSAGMDLSLFNAVDITADYYHRKNFDLIGLRPVRPSSGYYNKQLNWATMKNEGWEFSISFRPIKFTEDFSWKGMFNIGYNENTVVSNYIGNNPNLLRATQGRGYPFQGRPISGLYAFNLAGLDANGLAQFYDGKGNLVYGFTSGNRDYSNIFYQGSRDPLYSGGFTSSFTYKNFTLGASFVFNSGHVVRKNDFYKGYITRDVNDSKDKKVNYNMIALSRDDFNVPGDYRNRWRSYGDERFTNIPRLLDPTDERFYSNSGIFTSNAMEEYNKNNTRTIDASFLRVRSISLKYQFPSELVKNLGLSYLNADVQITNPWVFASKKLRGQDPEALIQGTNIPPIKSFTFNLSMGF